MVLSGNDSQTGGGGFCAGKFWDLSLTWDTTNPDFTPCFQQTVLAYLPAAVLLLLLPFQVV